MAVKVSAVVICDPCKEEILPNEEFVNAQVYGITAHDRCFSELNPWQVLRLLGLDDITFGRIRDYDAVKGCWSNDSYKRAMSVPAAQLPGRERHG